MGGGPPGRGAVAAVMPWAAEALAQYIGQVRPCYEASCPALWLTERGGRVSPRQIDDRFAAWRAAARPPGAPAGHRLRPSDGSHPIQQRPDPPCVEQRARPPSAATTA